MPPISSNRASSRSPSSATCAWIFSTVRCSIASISAARSGKLRYSVARPTPARSTTRSSGAVMPCSPNTASAASSNWARRAAASERIEVMRT